MLPQKFIAFSPSGNLRQKCVQKSVSDINFAACGINCQFERMLSTSDSELFTFAVLAYDLGIPMAVKMLGAAHRLDAENGGRQEKHRTLGE